MSSLWPDVSIRHCSPRASYRGASRAVNEVETSRISSTP
jgi:hypothetical protein